MPYAYLLPEAVLVLTALIVLLVDLWAKEKRVLGYLSLLGIAGALTSIWPAAATPVGEQLGAMIAVDTFSFFFKAVFLGVAGMVILAGMDFAEKREMPISEFYQLVMFATVGMMLMASSRDLITIYLGLELTAISSYVLAGILRHDDKSNEASIKYFLNGALASAVLLFGLSLVYGLTGTTHLTGIAANLQAGVISKPLLLTAMVFLVGGFGFKVAAAPFHFWAPDTYEGAPTPVTAFFSVGPKGAALAAMLRIFFGGFWTIQPQWALLWAVLAAASMLIGNLSALWQTDVKRMLAYSSIAHVGYILVGVVASNVTGSSAVIYYVLAYAVMNLGAFAVVIAVENQGLGTKLDDYRGLSERSPFLAYSLVLFFVSLIGIPPTAGFVGKFFLFKGALEAGYLWLALLMAVNSAISVGYYYAVVRNMFLAAPADDKPVAGLSPTPALSTAVSLAVVGTVGLVIAVQPFINWAVTAAGFVK